MDRQKNNAKDALDLLFDRDPSAKSFFDALPPVTQETIRQSGIDFSSCQDLKKCAENFMASD